MNQDDSPPPIQMFELPPDYDTAVNLPSPSDHQHEPPPAYRTVVSQLSGLTTSDPAPQRFINIDRVPLRATSDSAPPFVINVNQPSVLSRANDVQHQIRTAEPIDTSDDCRLSDECNFTLCEWAWNISIIMVFCGVLHALIPCILGSKYHYQQLHRLAFVQTY